VDGFKAIHQRHSELSEDQVGAKPFRGFYEAASVTDGADNSEFAGQQLAEASYKQAMSISDDQGWASDMHHSDLRGLETSTPK
jgi:hypothetical protein